MSDSFRGVQDAYDRSISRESSSMSLFPQAEEPVAMGFDTMAKEAEKWEALEHAMLSLSIKTTAHSEAPGYRFHQPNGSTESVDNEMFQDIPELPKSFSTILPFSVPSRGEKWLAENHLFYYLDSVSSLLWFLESLPELSRSEVQLFLDCEGNSLGRNGTLSLIQVSIASMNKTFILDITKLGGNAFDMVTLDGTSFRQILEDPHIPIVFFDVRNDSDALYAHYNVHLRGLIDLQLMELAIRDGWHNFQMGLDRCINRGTNMAFEECRNWYNIKDGGKQYCRQNTYSVFDSRPLAPILLKYAAQDVVYMPHLYALYLNKSRNKPFLRALVLNESKKRVDESIAPIFIRSRQRSPQAFVELDWNLGEWSEDEC